MASNLSLGIIVGASTSGSVARTFGAIKADAVGLGKTLNQVRLGRGAADDVIKYQNKLETLKATQAQFGVGNSRLWSQIADTERELRKASGAAEKYGLNIGDITRENARLLQSEQRIAGQLQRSNTLRSNKDKRSELGGQMIGTVGMVFAAAAPIKAAMEFESVMADVRKVVDLTDGEMKGLGKSILDMSKTMPMAASGIGAIVAAAGQSGVAKNELLGFTQAAVKMGVAFDMTGEEAGQTMASWRAGMAISQKQAEALADAVNHLDSNMNASAKNISEVIQRQGAVAKAAGLTEIQIAALSASLLNSGASPEIAATALKNLTNALTKGEAATKSQIEAYDTLGLKYNQVNKDMQTDAEGTIKKVFALLAKAPAADRGALVGGLFGEEAKGAIMPLLVNMKALDDAFASVGDASKYAGSMAKEYEIRSQTTTNAVQLLKNKFEALGVNLGSVLLPTLNKVFGVIGSGADFIAVWAEKFPLVTQAIVGVTVGLVALKVATLAYGFSVTLVSDAWVLATGTMAFFTSGAIATNTALAMQRIQLVGASIAQGAMAVKTGAITAAQWLWNAALSANPIGLVVIGITAFGALAYTVYKNWEPIMTWFRESFAWLGNAVSGVAGFAGKIGSALGGVAGAASQGATAGNPVHSLGELAKTGANAKLPSVQAAKGAGAATTTTNNPVFNITQQPGEDQNSLADRIMKKMQATQAKDKRGALHD